MSTTRYTNTYIQRSSIKLGEAPYEQVQIGTLVSEYRVQEYWDLRTTAASRDGAARRGYKVSLRQRVAIVNRSAARFGSLPSLTNYWGDHYPVLVSQNVQPVSPTRGVSFYLEGYAPKTLNAAVNTNSGSNLSASGENFIQHTAGSSVSSTHTWETHGALSLNDFNVGGGYSDSETSTYERSKTQGRSTTEGSQADEGSSMTVKDWASLAIVDACRQAPTWVWGQEYPWNVLQFHNQCPPSDGGVFAPPYMLNRLVTYTDDVSNGVLCPPSDISLTGLDFVAHATWIFLCDEVGWQDEQATFTHTLNYWEGAHGPKTDTGEPEPGQAALAGAPAPPNPLAFVALYHELVDTAIGEPVTLDLPLLSLKPIINAGPQNGAAVGFSRNELIFMGPVPEKEALPPPIGIRIKSTANNLYVRGEGSFSIQGRDSVLTAPGVTDFKPITFRIFFNLTDADIELSLYFKHWKTSDAGCVMSLFINDGPESGQDPITRHIDSKEEGAGSDNISAVILRKKDYRSTEFYDYLVLGLNSIIVRIAPESPSEECGYAIRALAIG